MELFFGKKSHLLVPPPPLPTSFTTFFLFEGSELRGIVWVHVEEAVQTGYDVVCVVAVDEALPAVVDKPAVDVGALLRVAPVVLLPAPEESKAYRVHNPFVFSVGLVGGTVPGNEQPAALHLHGSFLLQRVESLVDVVHVNLRLSGKLPCEVTSDKPLSARFLHSFHFMRAGHDQKVILQISTTLVRISE